MGYLWYKYLFLTEVRSIAYIFPDIYIQIFKILSATLELKYP